MVLRQIKQTTGFPGTEEGGLCGTSDLRNQAAAMGDNVIYQRPVARMLSSFVRQISQIIGQVISAVDVIRSGAGLVK